MSSGRLIQAVDFGSVKRSAKWRGGPDYDRCFLARYSWRSRRNTASDWLDQCRSGAPGRFNLADERYLRIKHSSRQMLQGMPGARLNLSIP